MDSREKDKGNWRLTIHVRPKLAHLIVLPGHLGLQEQNLFLALTDLHGEPDGHTLGCNLHVPLPLKHIVPELPEIALLRRHSSSTRH